MTKQRLLVLLALLALAAPVCADGPETGIVTGTVHDPTRTPLPGVQIELVGQRGSQVAVTDEQGGFRFALVPPGSYRVAASLQGFLNAEQTVEVSVGSRNDLEFTLSMTTSEEITVVSEAPMVDKYNVTAGAALRGETAGEIGATVRSFYGALQALPGVTSDAESMDLSQSRPTVNGSLWQESNVYIDGVDATFSLHGGSTRVFLPSSALTEVSLEAGGGGAEYGRNVGSHTNLIVKSGTNKFHFDASGVYARNSWNSNYDPQPALALDQRFVNTFIDKGYSADEAKRLVEEWVVYKPGERDGDEVNLEASVGGPIKRDKAWFFAARGEVSTNQIDKTLDGQRFDVSSELVATIAKINYQPGSRHNLAYTYIDAPVDRIFLLPAMGDRYVSTFYDISGDVNSLSWNWSVTKNMFMEVKAARQVSNEDTLQPFPPEVKFADPAYLPNPALGPFSPNNNDDAYVQTFDNTWNNGWIFEAGHGLNEFPREQFNAAFTQFATPNHELKYGLDLQQVEWNQDVSRPDIFSGYDFQLGTRYGFRNNCEGVAVDATAGGRDTRCFFLDFNGHGLIKGAAASDGGNSALYLRDRIGIGERWTLNAGLRFEQQSLENDRGREVIDQSTLSPRLSVVYDVKKDGRQLVTLSTGRFFVQTPQILVNTNLQEDWNGASNAFDLLMHVDSIPALRGFPDTLACQILAAGGSPIVFDRGAYCFSLGAVRPGQMWQMVDRGLFDVDIEPYHRDEIVLGYEWQFSENWALDAKGIWWELDNLIGSTQQRDPNFGLFLLVENYSDYAGILRGLGWVDNFVEQGLGTAAQAEAILDGFQDDHRRYRGLQLQANRRFAKGWALYNNLTFSNAEGRTYGGGNGANDLGAFSNVNDDYGRNLEAILTNGILNSFAAIPGFCASNGLGPSCIDDLRPFVGQPLSTINRQGDMPIDRPIIYKSYGYRQWEHGKQTWSLGGLFVWQSGSPWERTRSFSLPTCGPGVPEPCFDLLDVARDVAVNTFMVPRGEFDNPDFWFLNLTGSWGFPIGRTTGQLRMEVTNVTDEQRQVATSDRTGAPLRSRRSFQQPRKLRLIASVRF